MAETPEHTNMQGAKTLIILRTNRGGGRGGGSILTSMLGKSGGGKTMVIDRFFKGIIITIIITIIIIIIIIINLFTVGGYNIAIYVQFMYKPIQAYFTIKGTNENCSISKSQMSFQGTNLENIFTIDKAKTSIR